MASELIMPWEPGKCLHKTDRKREALLAKQPCFWLFWELILGWDQVGFLFSALALSPVVLTHSCVSGLITFYSLIGFPDYYPCSMTHDLNISPQMSGEEAWLFLSNCFSGDKSEYSSGLRNPKSTYLEKEQSESKVRLSRPGLRCTDQNLRVE